MIKQLLGILSVVLLLSGCKPTEAGYKNAYDAALAKRQAAEAEAMIPATGLIPIDGPKKQVIYGDSLFVENERLSRNEVGGEPLAYYVVVAKFKMSTNAKANANALKAKGWQNANAYQITGDRWCVVIGGDSDLKKAVEMLRKFEKSNADYPYIGLPGAPIILRAN